jgi:hypothetical protein
LVDYRDAYSLETGSLGLAQLFPSRVVMVDNPSFTFGGTGDEESALVIILRHWGIHIFRVQVEA